MPPLDSEPEFDTVDFSGLAAGQAVGQAFQPAVTDGLESPPLQSPLLQSPSLQTRVFASVGAPLPGVELAIVNESGGRLPERHTGEIILRSPSMMSGYLRDEEATRSALRDGWLYTGDLGYLANGQLFITGRKKELIIVGGRNYYPDDVEQIACAVPGVRAGRVVAIGVEDAEQATERLVVLAEIDKTESDERDSLKMLVRHTLIAAGYPVSDVVLLKPKSIQSTLTGKPMRVQSKARFLAGEFSSTDATDATDGTDIK